MTINSFEDIQNHPSFTTSDEITNSKKQILSHLDKLSVYVNENFYNPYLSHQPIESFIPNKYMGTKIIERMKTFLLFKEAAKAMRYNEHNPLNNISTISCVLHNPFYNLSGFKSSVPEIVLKYITDGSKDRSFGFLEKEWSMKELMMFETAFIMFEKQFKKIQYNINLYIFDVSKKKSLGDIMRLYFRYKSTDNYKSWKEQRKYFSDEANKKDDCNPVFYKVMEKANDIFGD